MESLENENPTIQPLGRVRFTVLPFVDAESEFDGQEQMMQGGWLKETGAERQCRF